MTDDRSRPSLATRRGIPDVYQPAADSDLLATAATDDVTGSERVLDVGTGSGYVATALTGAGTDVVASDINPNACEQAAGDGFGVVRGNLLEPFRANAFDVVTFNPPYLPTAESDEWDDWMEKALSGGEDGRAVIEPFLDDVTRVLAPDGRVLMLVSSLTDIDAVRRDAADCGLAGDVVTAESYPYERLVVLRFYRR